jgi:hypothetical protein
MPPKLYEAVVAAPGCPGRGHRVSGALAGVSTRSVAPGSDDGARTAGMGFDAQLDEQGKARFLLGIQDAGQI